MENAQKTSARHGCGAESRRRPRATTDLAVGEQAMDGAQEAPRSGARRDARERAAGAAHLDERMDALAAVCT